MRSQIAIVPSDRLMCSLPTRTVEDPRSAPFHLCQLGTHPSDAMLVGGLRMVRSEEDPEFPHHPVMLEEVIGWFAPVPSGLIVDMTLGGAGHAAGLLETHPHVSILGLDRDDTAIVAARRRLARFGDRAEVRKVRFDAAAAAALDAFPGVPVVGVLFDLGVSSVQLDVADRGFSYRKDGPLDMRMDRSDTLTAADVVNDYDQDTLAGVLRDGGEERFAGRIARAIVSARPIDTTAKLAEVVRDAIPAAARRRPGDPAKRSFQAIRMEVNRELEVLSDALDFALDLVSPGGRIVTIAYHSGEDRLIKSRFVDAASGGCKCPPGLLCVCGAIPRVRVLTKGARKPDAREILENPRAKSARLRVVEAL